MVLNTKMKKIKFKLPPQAQRFCLEIKKKQGLVISFLNLNDEQLLRINPE